MTKFNIGDRVRTKFDDSVNFCGKIIDVKRYQYCKPSYMVEDKGHGCKLFDENRLELDTCNGIYVTSEPFKVSKFKVGDRVKTNKDYFIMFDTNITGIVTSIETGCLITGRSYYLITICTIYGSKTLYENWLEFNENRCISDANMTIEEMSTRIQDCLEEVHKKQNCIDAYKKELCEKNKQILNLQERNNYLSRSNIDKSKEIWDLKREICDWDILYLDVDYCCDYKKQLNSNNHTHKTELISVFILGLLTMHIINLILFQ